jgi:hypothetical protein
LNRFRSPGNNNLLTKALFFELALADKSLCVYTLKDHDHTVEGVTYPSLYKLYMSVNDPTEYRFATKHLDGWEHWEALSSCTWFQPYLERWRRELETRMKSEALARIMQESKTTSKESFAASKYLLEKGWDKPQEKRGRPSKEQIQKQAHEIASSNNVILEDFKRLNIN